MKSELAMVQICTKRKVTAFQCQEEMQHKLDTEMRAMNRLQMNKTKPTLRVYIYNVQNVFHGAAIPIHPYASTREDATLGVGGVRKLTKDLLLP